ncbi:MAG: PocR ligand-binding domain-containing protein [Eubacteriales bacterium]|nr:PocR ligand-binding domain-containing protein [Eubacteriales bacterium]
MITDDSLKRLGHLLNNLYLCTGIKFGLMDENSREVYTSSYQTAFCRMIADEMGGYERCAACDGRALSALREAGVWGKRKYLCHAGLYELALPVTEEGKTVAFILCGQILDDSPREEQWKRVLERCGWVSDKEALHQAFLSLKRVSTEQMNACMELVQACISEVRLYGMEADLERSDTQRLKSYIESHYAEPLTTERLCQALNVGKTKLFQLCAQGFAKTPGQLVLDTRMEAARDLLRNTARPIRTIAQAVGFPDENYFTKVFKRAQGVVPSGYRKQNGAYAVNVSYNKEGASPFDTDSHS